MTAKLAPGPTLWAIDDQRKPAELAPEPPSGPSDPANGSVDPKGAQNGATVPQTENRMLFQRCLRCGTDEAAGSYCTWCRTAEYELVEHTHTMGGRGGGCPLGPYVNPSRSPAMGPASWSTAQQRLKVERTAWESSPAAGEAERYVVRRWTHPARPAASAKGRVAA